ncbi:MAG: TM2 domain-containing protein [Gemmatimonadales bacterium]|uniref:TM2 domain-containing protein n=1 Tax=Candidatus Palauibacter irciniicola TaxID=3056733 RepID=UPI001382359E|nr:TM2 domain-containing protein [Candidatus Palauibacter irciniicola]MYC18075.1 TM2 domain-containing protein [Gemmatimonadales bacterium]
MRGDQPGPGTSDDTLFGLSALHQGPPQVPGRGDLDFSRAVLDQLYSYRPKREGIAYPLWLLTGIFGGHRFYLDRPGTGLLMLLTVGGAGLWWLVDVLLIPRMVRKFNEDQARRRFLGLPPRQLAFMPAKGETLPPEPHWAAKRGTRVRLVADSVVMMLAGGSLGTFARGFGVYEPIIAVLALIAITLLGTRWAALSNLPILRGFDRWAHRLRLFYYTNDPGGAVSLAFRQVLAAFAILRRRRRAEARLYLQFGVWFTIIFTVFDIIEAASGTGGFTTSLVRDFYMTLFATYAFAAPIGAILNKHVLLQRSDRVIWVLSGVAVLFIATSLF